jgi:hypothetical protein
MSNLLVCKTRLEDRCRRPGGTERLAQASEERRPASGQRPRGLESKAMSLSVISWPLESSAGGALAAAARPRGWDTKPLLLPLPDACCLGIRLDRQVRSPRPPRSQRRIASHHPGPRSFWFAGGLRRTLVCPSSCSWPGSPTYTMLCQSVSCFHSSDWLSFRRRLVATLNLVTLLRLG